MRNSKNNFISILMVLVITYFVITTVVFLISVNSGRDGISIMLFGGGDDGNFYWIQANNVAQGLPWVKTSIYSLILGKILFYTGIYSPYIIRIFNQVGFLLLIYYSLAIINLQHSDNFLLKQTKAYSTKTLVLVYYLFYISLVMMVNLSIYRDVWIYALFVASMSYYIKVTRNRKFSAVPLFLLSLWLLYEFRKYAALSIIISIVVYHSYRFFVKRIRIKALLVCFLFFFSVYYTFFIDFRVPVVNMSLRNALNYRESVMLGGSQMGISFNQPNVFLFIVNYLYSFIGNMVGPLPWHISGWSTFLVFLVETIPMIYILRYIYRARHSFSKVQKYLITNAGVWLVLISVTNDNLGTGTRLRVPAWIILILIFAVLKTRRFKYRVYGNKISLTN